MRGSVLQQAHRPVFDAFTIGSNGNGATGGRTDPFTIRPQSSEPQFDGPPAATIAAWTEESMDDSESTSPPTAQAQRQAPQPPPVYPVPSSTHFGDFNGVLRNGSSMIFTAPNCAQEYESQRRPGTSWMRGREPVKAAGDVSLTGPQLVPFLFKACLRLSEVKCEGVQMRLRQLEQRIGDNQLDEPCIKKLNYVVDALDRGAYDEAWQHYESMKASFPEEMSLNWSHGLRLLIRELLPKQRISRVGSAGGHVRAQ